MGRKRARRISVSEGSDRTRERRLIREKKCSEGRKEKAVILALDS